MDLGSGAELGALNSSSLPENLESGKTTIISPSAPGRTCRLNRDLSIA
jgi:hypothetical protein